MHAFSCSTPLVCTASEKNQPDMLPRVYEWIGGGGEG